MDTVYIVLVRWSSEWAGQDLYRTKSKALFDYIVEIETSYWSKEEPTFDKFSEELKSDLRNKRDEQAIEYPELTPSTVENITLSEAMEWLDSYGEDYNKFPVILGGTAKLTFLHWNY